MSLDPKNCGHIWTNHLEIGLVVGEAGTRSSELQVTCTDP